MDETERALNAALDEDPSDSFTRSVLADFYEDAGRAEDASRERWIASIGKYPAVDDVTPRFPWDWWPRDNPVYANRPDHAKVDYSIFRLLDNSGSYRTRQQAEADLFLVREEFDAQVATQKESVR